MTPKFLQLHYLTDYTGALLNRDENGLAKRLPKGEHIRTRVSSQCIKYHLRKADGPYALTHTTPDPVRTKELADTRIMNHVRQEIPGADGEAIEAAIIALNIGLYGKDAADPNKRQLLLFGRPEIDWLQARTCEAVRNNPEPEDAAKAVSALFNGSDAKHNFTAFRTNLAMPSGIQGAFFGRMVTADPLARIDGALHVAHAFTIHEEAPETDFFTAMDDLRSQQQGGSGFLGNTEINSGIFYSYMCVDLPMLVSNTTGCAPEDWLDSDRELAAEASAALAALAATTSTGAKKGSTAAHAWAQVLLAELGDRAPRSLAGAYTLPARPNVQDGLRKMQEHLAEFDRMYGPPHEGRRLMAPGNPATIDQIRIWIHDSIAGGEVK